MTLIEIKKAQERGKTMKILRTGATLNKEYKGWKPVACVPLLSICQLSELAQVMIHNSCLNCPIRNFTGVPSMYKLQDIPRYV